MNVEIRQAELDGKTVTFTNHTVFYIELGNGPKGRWRCRYIIRNGNLAQAVLWYKGINIGPNVKKRLYGEFMIPPVLLRNTGW